MVDCHYSCLTGHGHGLDRLLGCRTRLSQMHGHRGRRGFSRDAGKAGPMRTSRRLWQLLVLSVVAALVVSIAGAVGVTSPPRAAAATATDDNPEPSVPARPLPPPADDSKDHMP